MNSGILICLLFVSGIAVASAQDGFFQTMMLMNMLGGGRTRGGTLALRGRYPPTLGGQTRESSVATTGPSKQQPSLTVPDNGNGGRGYVDTSGPGGQQLPQPYGGFRTVPSRRSSGRGLLGMMALTGQGGDVMRDMLLCNTMPASMRMMCMMSQSL